jgi:superfamily II DNA or RNA helicase|uniref:Helicase ATP-binding domain-containing protein n=1 Tax=viral metagenome TaxID=1070528 RepID=A0A6C0JR82_9ZZZZ
MFKINKNALCIRKSSNFSYQDKKHKLDKSNFDLNNFKKSLPITSPKVIELLKNIKELDASDMKNHNKKFKHIIYTDIKESSAGAKMIAASMLSDGYKNVYEKDLKLKDDKILLKTKDKNFALLCSVQLYDKPFSMKLKKNIIAKYNSRPENINGSLIRFIVLDQGYKEGIDLFDVKYLHIFEPLITRSDEKQVIGRGTRFCGQKGLKFQENIGWPLNVFKYNSYIENNKKEFTHDLFMNNSGLDLTKILFSVELEKITKYGAVDYELNKNIHQINDRFSNTNNEDSIYTNYRINSEKKLKLGNKILNPLDIISKGGGIKGKRKKGLNINLTKTVKNKKKFLEIRKIISEKYSDLKWEKIILKNGCEEKTEKKIENKKKAKSIGGAKSEPILKKIKKLSKKIKSEPIMKFKNNKKKIKSEPKPEKNKPPSLPPKDERLIDLTPTQKFVSKYFTHESPYNGLLLWHSVGTGKTCSAISIASRGFEEHNYTILWVTRHTLKTDIWKNMFQQVCSSIIRRKIIQGENIPKNIKKNYLQYLTNNWVMPISYKQFSNMLQGRNEYYKIMKKKNGETDILRKTLVIIDEAHKLYSVDTIPSERPNIQVINEKIKKSYKISGSNSVKLLLMTATPYTTDPMHLIKLINLMKDENDQMPEDYKTFTETYLDENGIFTNEGAKEYLDNMAGYISYLNREKDVRNFAYPIFYNIDVKISEQDKKIKTLKNDLAIEQENVEKIKNELENADKKNKKPIKEKIVNHNKKVKEMKKRLKELTEKDYSQETIINSCLTKKK